MWKKLSAVNTFQIHCIFLGCESVHLLKDSFLFRQWWRQAKSKSFTTLNHTAQAQSVSRIEKDRVTFMSHNTLFSCMWTKHWTKTLNIDLVESKKKKKRWICRYKKPKAQTTEKISQRFSSWSDHCCQHFQSTPAPLEFSTKPDKISSLWADLRKYGLM